MYFYHSNISFHYVFSSLVMFDQLHIADLLRLEPGQLLNGDLVLTGIRYVLLTYIVLFG